MKKSELSLVFNFLSEKRMCLNEIFLAKSLLTIDVSNDFVEFAVFICWIYMLFYIYMFFYIKLIN